VADRKTDKGVTTLVSELRELVVAYLKQETLEPIKGLVGFLAWGLAGSFFLGTGLLLLALALLRGLQSIDTFDGNLSFVPYLAVVVAAGIVAAIAVSRIGAGPASEPTSGGRSSADVLPSR
jgi:hypothetical protein